MKVVIVGNGIAGNEVAYHLRQYSSSSDITIISAENDPEYDPCLLPYYLGHEIKREMVFRKKISEYANHGINLIPNSSVVGLDPNRQLILTHRDEKFNYDKLVLAHGGQLFMPPIPGKEKAGVFKSKQLPDIDLLSNHQGTKAVVIGSGAIGVETAVALSLIGYQVTIIELQDRLMPTMFDQPIATILKHDLENLGIQVFCQEKVVTIAGEKKVTGITTDKRTLDCDTVIIATGVVVDKKFAQAANLQVNRGIQVNTKLETAISNIYACGDCAETPGIYGETTALFQLKHNALNQGKIVARNILGANISYSGSYPFARIHFQHTYAASFGKTAQEIKDQSALEVITQQKNNSLLNIIVDHNIIVGAQAIGNYATSLGLLFSAMMRGDNLKHLHAKQQNIFDLSSSFPWFYKKLINLTTK